MPPSPPIASGGAIPRASPNLPPSCISSSQQTRTGNQEPSDTFAVHETALHLFRLPQHSTQVGRFEARCSFTPTLHSTFTMSTSEHMSEQAKLKKAIPSVSLSADDCLASSKELKGKVVIVTGKPTAQELVRAQSS